MLHSSKRNLKFAPWKNLNQPINWKNKTIQRLSLLYSCIVNMVTAAIDASWKIHVYESSESLECFAPLNSCHLILWVHASGYVNADPCSEGVSSQLLSGAMHSSGHKNFAGRRSLENLYGQVHIDCFAADLLLVRPVETD